MENSGIMKYGLGLHCGSGLARECGMSANMNVECYKAFASKPDPTGGRAKPRKMAVILKQNGDHWPPFSASVKI
jgi:hypothetical protein